MFSLLSAVPETTGPTLGELIEPIVRMKPQVYLLCGLGALALFFVAIVLSIWSWVRNQDSARRVVTPTFRFTVFIFFAVYLLFLPFRYDVPGIRDVSDFFKPFAVSLLDVIRTFLADGEVDALNSHVFSSEFPTALAIFYSSIASVLATLAPILTFGNLIALFRNIKDEGRFALIRSRDLYIMSEMNPRSVALGESIRKNCPRSKIVYTEVFEQNEEEQFELLNRVHNIRAICLKRDVSSLKVLNKKRVKIYLIGDDESENIHQAISIRRTISEFDRPDLPAIYVYASAPSATHIIDSLCGGKIELNQDIKARITEILDKEDLENHRKFELIQKLFHDKKPYSAGEIEEALDKTQCMKKTGNLPSNDPSEETDHAETMAERVRFLRNDSIKMNQGFILRRVDSTEEMVISTLTGLRDRLLPRIKEDRRVSILIVGLGESGRQFLKTSLWFFQQEGYRLEINVIENSPLRRLGQGENAETVSESVRKFTQECPEIVSTNGNFGNGEGNYDIRFLSGIDCFSSSFDAAFLSGADAKRLARTQVAFVTLGDDDKNIEASLMLRKIFDRVHGVTEKDIKADMKGKRIRFPLIYSVVYDDQKAFNVNDSLSNHKKQPFDISFIGSLEKRFSFGRVELQEERAEDAFEHHLEWVIVQSNLRKCYGDGSEPTDEKEQKMYATFRKNYKEHLKNKYRKKKIDEGTSPSEVKEPEPKDLVPDWGDSFFYEVDDDHPDIETAPINVDYVLGEFRQYVNYEYFRESSIARHLHKTHIIESDTFKDRYRCLNYKENENPVCECENCERRRITEHMRWCVYLRTKGYVRGPRNDRAKQHHLLIPWEELPYPERFKD